MESLIVNGVEIKAGDVFGDWTILDTTKLGGKRKPKILVKCKCGRIAERLLYPLIRVDTVACRSCGTTRNGYGKLPERAIWRLMIDRCYRAESTPYPYYGGRGISVCQRWRDSFEDFLLDMGSRPTKSHTLDRYPDNDGNYEPSNCRWATKREQNINSRHARMITYNGVTLCAKEHAEIAGLKPDTLYGRLYCGWSVEKALSTPTLTAYRREKK